MTKLKGLTGRKYGKLRAIERVGRIKHDRQTYKCLCDCGNMHIVTGKDLVSGNTKSCGCYRIELNHYIGGNTARNKRYGDYRLRAKKKNLQFDLTVEDFEGMAVSNCFYCNEEPKQITKHGRNKIDVFVHNGIDRVDNLKGYTKDNCVPCCKHCNVAKGAMTKKEFLDLIERIYLQRGVKDEEDFTDFINSDSTLFMLPEYEPGGNGRGPRTY